MIHQPVVHCSIIRESERAKCGGMARPVARFCMFPNGRRGFFVKKVCFLVSSLGSLGGAGRVVANVANRMACDYEVHVLGTYGGANQQPAFPLDARVAHMNFFDEEGRLRDTAKALRRPLKSYLAEHGIDVVFLVGNYQGFMALPVVLSSRAKFVFCDHGALMNQWDQKDIRTIRWLCSRFCDATVTLTEQSRSAYIERFRLKPERVVSIYNWIPDAQVQAAPGYDVSSQKIVWAGRLDPEKGVEFMLDIAAKVLPSRPGWMWDVYGKAVIADGDEAWPDRVRDRGLEGRLNIKGPVPDLYARYPDYGLCALTSYREACPWCCWRLRPTPSPQ